MLLVFRYNAHVRGLSTQYEVTLIIYQEVINKCGFFLIECNLCGATPLMTIVPASRRISQEY